MKRHLKKLFGWVFAALLTVGLAMPYAAQAQSSFSASPAFLAALQVDINVINSVRPCQTSIIPTPAFYNMGSYYSDGDNGLFSGLHDSQGNAFCDDTIGSYGGPPGNPGEWFIGIGQLTGVYKDMTNAQVIRAAWPNLACYLGLGIDPGCQLPAPAEVFVEEYSVVANFPDTLTDSKNAIAGSDGIVLNGSPILACTMAYVRQLNTDGTAPQNLAQIQFKTANGPDQSSTTTYGCDGSVTAGTYEGIPYD